MKNHKQLLADFYLELLAIPSDDKFRLTIAHVYPSIRRALADILNEDEETIQRIFERMAAEDAKI